jgi:hypothetical protein
MTLISIVSRCVRKEYTRLDLQFMRQMAFTLPFLTPVAAAAAVLLSAHALLAVDLPASVAKSLAQIAPADTAPIIEITPFNGAGESLYLVEIQIPGSSDKREWYFDAQGVPVGVQVFQKEVPRALSDFLTPWLLRKTASVSGMVKIFDSGHALFEVEVKALRDSRLFGFHADGTLAHTQTELSALPDLLQTSLKALLQTDGPLESILRLQGTIPALYQLAIERPDKPLWITVDASGAEVEREELVAFKSTPYPVQTAVLAKTGSGEGLRILSKRTGKTQEFTVHFFREVKLHTFRLTENGETAGPSPEPLALP